MRQVGTKKYLLEVTKTDISMLRGLIESYENKEVFDMILKRLDGVKERNKYVAKIRMCSASLTIKIILEELKQIFIDWDIMDEARLKNFMAYIKEQQIQKAVPKKLAKRVTGRIKLKGVKKNAN